MLVKENIIRPWEIKKYCRKFQTTKEEIKYVGCMLLQCHVRVLEWIHAL